MSRVLIYSGTTEGRTIAYKLSEMGVDVVVSVATEYGEMVMDEDKNITILKGRMDVDQMRELKDFDAVIDATHPFATAVTENIVASLKGSNIPYFRVSRAEDDVRGSICRYYDSVKDCVTALEALAKRDADARILLTTGSNDLKEFTADPLLKDKLVVRVLPGIESISLCYEAGLNGNQIIAMQGPFSADMNLSQIKEYGITALVTKASGSIGGTNMKVEACEKADIPCLIINRPASREGAETYSVEECIEKIRQTLGLENTMNDNTNNNCIIDVALVGIGMGGSGSLTVDVEERIKNSNVLFGASRMLESVISNAAKYPYYMAADIIPRIETLKSHGEDCKVTILFSGDTGFYSGCSKLYAALCKIDGIKVTIMPGISSIVYLAGKAGLSWQDARIVSTHSVEPSQWESKIIYSSKVSGKTFFLTSGPEDLQEIGKLLINNGLSGVRIVLGYQLSYPEEKVWEIKPIDACGIEEPGLYSGIIVNDSPKPAVIGPSLRDEDFIRGKVPMTKEEVRHVSVSKLGLTRDSVVVDIGAGTGSVALEIARMSPDIKVFAIESADEAVDLIKINRDHLGLNNVQIIQALAPDMLDTIPVPTHAFIGGSRGHLRDILKTLYSLNPRMRVVMNAVSMENICAMNALIGELKATDVTITQMNVSHTKKLGDYNLLQAGNPVFIFAFTFTE